MNLFGRRPLCLFCCIFMLVLLLNWLAYDDQWSPILFFSVAGIALLLTAGLIVFRSCRILLLTVLLCCITVLFSCLYSFCTIVQPQRKAAEYVGEQRAVCYVIEEDRMTEYSSCYLVKVEQIEQNSTEIRAALLCPKGIILSPQDRVAARFVISEGAALQNAGGNSALLTLELAEPSAAYIQRAPSDMGWIETLFSDSGLRIVSNRVRDRIGEQLQIYLGDEKGALANGFLLGDRSDLSSSITRDFRRSGTSHMMAVSGMHISLLLGSLGLLLQKLYVPKKIRCALLSVLAFAFLCLTGFSLSACRSVLMLYAVYLSYLFYEDHDSVTALFVSMVLILLISPWAVTDLGLWMSFLATLGLLTVYSLWEAHVPYPSKQKGIRKKALLVLRTVALLFEMTLVANLFLLPIYQLFFKEISLISLLSNIVLFPLSNLFLVSIPILLLVGAIPILGDGVLMGVRILAEWLLDLIAFFASVPHATLSLRYPFAGWIVLGFTVGMGVLLLVRLRRTWLLALPPALAGVAFLACLGWYLSVYDAPELTYLNDGSQNEWIVLEEKDELSVCDISDGGWRGYAAIDEARDRSVATELYSLFFTHYHRGHTVMLDISLQNLIVRQVCLPSPADREEAEIAKELWDICGQYGVSVIFYEEGEVLSLLDSVGVQACRDTDDGQTAIVLNVAGRRAELTYASPQINDSSMEDFAKRSMCQSKRVLIGCHGQSEEKEIFCGAGFLDNLETVIFSSTSGEAYRFSFLLE